MTMNRKILLPLAFVSTALIMRSMSRGEASATTSNNQDKAAQPSATKFGPFAILNAYCTFNENKLREKGFNPVNLHQSGSLSFMQGENFRARMQYSTMLRFTPHKDEAEIFELAGNTLSQKGFASLSGQHWQKAYVNGHRPFTMTMLYGQYCLVAGNLYSAENVFKAVIESNPQMSAPYNELGVTYFMQAVLHSDLNAFTTLQTHAKQNFTMSQKLDADNSIATQNHAVASALTSRPAYGPVWGLLKTAPNSSTRMLDALTQGLEENAKETKTNFAFGATFPDGRFVPLFVGAEEKKPNLANEVALAQLEQIKSAEFKGKDEPSSGMCMRR